MKKYLIYFLIGLFVSFTAKAQTKRIAAYSELPPEGIYLAEGWQYSSEDNPAFADTYYDDSKWHSINPLKMLYQLPELKNVSIGWVRLHFTVSPQIAGNAPVLNVSQNCASEVYLDGKLVKKYGVVSSNPSEVLPKGMNQPAESLRLIPGKKHVLAIRFSPWRGAYYLKNNGYLMRLNLNSLSGFQEQRKIVNGSYQAYFVLVSIFFLISLLHLSFYRYDRNQKANLFFSFYTLISAVTFTLVCMQVYVQDARLKALVFAPAFVIALMGNIWTVKALGRLFGINTHKYSLILWMVYIPAVAALLLFEIKMSFYVVSIFFQGVNILIAVKALQAGRRGVGFIIFGFILSVIALAVTAMVQFSIIDLDDFIVHSIIGLTYLAPAVGISLYLAREFSLNSVLLREKLLQVEALSEKNLQQEQEKQALLSQQNEVLEQQVAERTSELTHSLEELKQTQNQLIQSEKMASLGELTAGIAHEIQNPLNFVNNFSDVSIELLDEMGEELNKGDIEEAKAIAADVKQNLEKIANHGRRADGIVKGMLQHSRASSGQKESTDINVLADEYLRLAYHGLRAKDKSFNAELVTHFDENLPKINVIPQDVGRVLLNLFTNAFYATQKKSQSSDYKPTVSVFTSQKENSIAITVKDNGIGIPDAIKDKILQPFFTTKPTGEGTGLGLSLSYDIVVKGHNGSIAIESEEGVFTTFTVSLPT